MKKAAQLISILVLVAGFRAQAQVSTYKLQAVYVFNFAKYIKWTADSPTFVIGILGSAEVTDFFQNNLKNKKIANKSLEIRMLENINDVSQCQIVYLSKSKSKQLTAVARQVVGKEVLVVTEEDLAAKGAAISFFVEDNTLKFKLNSSVMNRSGLMPSSGLLSLATIVHEK